MSYSVYKIDLPESPEAVIFVNGILARNRAGFWWMWRNGVWIRNVTAQASGCVQVKAGICGLNELVLVSYWVDVASLKNFFKSEHHRQMMQVIAEKPKSLCLYNETYKPSQSGKYINEPQGMATIYAPEPAR